MKPQKKAKTFEETEQEEDKKADVEIKKKMLPGLALPNDPKVRVSS